MSRTIRLRDDGPQSFQHRNGVSASQDDPVVEDVPDDLAEYLVEDTGHFDYADDADAEAAAAGEMADDTVGAARAENAEPERAAASTQPPFDPGEYNVGELESHLADNEFSEGELSALVEAERAGKGRTTAVEAFEDARPGADTVPVDEAEADAEVDEE